MWPDTRIFRLFEQSKVLLKTDHGSQNTIFFFFRCEQNMRSYLSLWINRTRHQKLFEKCKNENETSPIWILNLNVKCTVTLVLMRNTNRWYTLVGITLPVSHFSSFDHVDVSVFALPKFGAVDLFDFRFAVEVFVFFSCLLLFPLCRLPSLLVQMSRTHYHGIVYGFFILLTQSITSY